MKRRLLQIGICVGVLLVVTALVPGYSKIAQRVQSVMASDVLLLDPGHGGMD